MSAAADFFKWREDWLKIVPVRNRHGNWDVHLVLDEGYGDLADALWNCDNYRQRIEQACAEDGTQLGTTIGAPAAALTDNPMPALLSGPDSVTTPDTPDRERTTP